MTLNSCLLGCASFQELPTPRPTPRELPYTREWAMNGRVCQESSHWLRPLGRNMMRLHLADSSDIQMERHEKGPADDGWLNGQWMGIAPESVASANSSSPYGWACATWVDFNLTCNYCTYPPPFFLNFHFMKLNSHLFSNRFLACYWSHYSSICPFFFVFYMGFLFYVLCFIWWFCSFQ